MARVKPEAMPRKPRSLLDSLQHALSNAKELAVEVGRSASTGWPLWWLQDVVLEYCARPDEVSISDALSDPSSRPFGIPNFPAPCACSVCRPRLVTFPTLARTCPLRPSALHTSFHLCWNLCGLWPLSRSSSTWVALRPCVPQTVSLDRRHRLWLPSRP